MDVCGNIPRWMFLPTNLRPSLLFVLLHGKEMMRKHDAKTPLLPPVHVFRASNGISPPHFCRVSNGGVHRTRVTCEREITSAHPFFPLCVCVR